MAWSRSPHGTTVFRPLLIFLISNHHLGDPKAREDLDAAIIYLADTISRMAFSGIGADGLAYRVYDETFGRLGVSEADMQELMAAFKLNLNSAKRLFHEM